MIPLARRVCVVTMKLTLVMIVETPTMNAPRQVTTTALSVVVLYGG